MRKLLYKEMKLSANPLSYWFIAFSAMTMLPRYPILVGSFFICLGIFHTYQQIREYDDITYTVMLPVKKQNVVTAKYLFVLFIEFTAFILCILLTVIRMKALGNAAPYVTNQLMNANAAYLGYVMIVFATFNSIFLAGFLQDWETFYHILCSRFYYNNRGGDVASYSRLRKLKQAFKFKHTSGRYICNRYNRVHVMYMVIISKSCKVF